MLEKYILLLSLIRLPIHVRISFLPSPEQSHIHSAEVTPPPAPNYRMFSSVKHDEELKIETLDLSGRAP